MLGLILNKKEQHKYRQLSMALNTILDGTILGGTILGGTILGGRH